MLESFPVSMVVGAVLGFLAGLGVGGGSLLILWLSLVLGMDHGIARSMNLLFFIPSAVIASLFRWKQGTLDFRKILPAILGGCASAVVCAWLSRRIDVSLIRKLFGGLLLLTGVRELFYKDKETSYKTEGRWSSLRYIITFWIYGRSGSLPGSKMLLLRPRCSSAFCRDSYARIRYCELPRWYGVRPTAAQTDR